jgi:hypothetical protein
MGDMVPGPQAYFRGESDMPGAKINMGWQKFVKPFKLELESHHHDTDEYLIFLGAELPDLVGSFDAEIELFLGTEYQNTSSPRRPFSMFRPDWNTILLTSRNSAN